MMDAIDVQFHEGILPKGLNDLRKMLQKEILQLLEAHVADSHQQKLFGAAFENVREIEVGILGDDNPSTMSAEGCNLGIWSVIATRKPLRMNRLMSKRLNNSTQREWQMSVYE